MEKDRQRQRSQYSINQEQTSRSKKITKIRPKETQDDPIQTNVHLTLPAELNVTDISPRTLLASDARYLPEGGKRFDTPQKDLNFSNTFDLFYGTLDNTAPATATPQKNLMKQKQMDIDNNIISKNSRSNYFDLMSDHNSDENLVRGKKGSDKVDDEETSKFDLSELSLPAHVLPLESPRMSLASNNLFSNNHLKDLYEKPEIIDFNKNLTYNANKEFKRFQSMSHNFARYSQEPQSLHTLSTINPLYGECSQKDGPPMLDLSMSGLSNQLNRTNSELIRTVSNSNPSKEDIIPTRLANQDAPLLNYQQVSSHRL